MQCRDRSHLRSYHIHKATDTDLDLSQQFDKLESISQLSCSRTLSAVRYLILNLDGLLPNERAKAYVYLRSPFQDTTMARYDEMSSPVSRISVDSE